MWNVFCTSVLKMLPINVAPEDVLRRCTLAHFSRVCTMLSFDKVGLNKREKAKGGNFKLIFQAQEYTDRFQPLVFCFFLWVDRARNPAVNLHYKKRHLKTSLINPANQSIYTFIPRSFIGLEAQPYGCPLLTEWGHNPIASLGSMQCAWVGPTSIVPMQGCRPASLRHPSGRLRIGLDRKLTRRSEAWLILEYVCGYRRC